MTAPTHDVQAEENVIGSCLVDPAAVVKCAATGLVADEFWTLFGRYTYGAIRAVAETKGAEAVNRVTVGYELGKRPADDGTGRTQIEVVGLEWLSRLEEDLVTSVGAEWYAGIVRECAARRRQVAVGMALAEGRATEKQAMAMLGTGDSDHTPIVVRRRVDSDHTPIEEPEFRCHRCPMGAVAYDEWAQPVCREHAPWEVFE